MRAHLSEFRAGGLVPVACIVWGDSWHNFRPEPIGTRAEGGVVSKYALPSIVTFITCHLIQHFRWRLWLVLGSSLDSVARTFAVIPLLARALPS